ncbi:hypothetical protein SAMN02910356_02248 [Selenomonas sp. GACV-9]|uniref:hypothetical protein n=1 Tax=Selenomonas sp. GACV-9 TaxID=3158782 RepID=UPI0008F3400A|nr:hypothetical protein SAMN02910356_02248 [Selenomonas ruminantium]
MAINYNIAQCLLNEEKHSPDEIQVLLKQGEENEGAMVRLLPKVETIDTRPVRTAVLRAAGDGYEDKQLSLYITYVEIFIEKLRELVRTEAVIAQDPCVELETAPAYAVSVRIDGDYEFVGGVVASEPVFIELARRYSGDDTLQEVDDMAIDACAEFLNVVQGLFSVTMARQNLEGELQLPRWRQDIEPHGNCQLCLRVYTSFGAFQIVLAVDEFF